MVGAGGTRTCVYQHVSRPIYHCAKDAAFVDRCHFTLRHKPANKRVTCTMVYFWGGGEGVCRRHATKAADSGQECKCEQLTLIIIH